MKELEPLKEGEAEIFVRIKKDILKVTLPPLLVKKLTDMQEEIKAADILEVLVKSAESIISTMQTLKQGEHSQEREGEKVKIEKDEEPPSET